MSMPVVLTPGTIIGGHYIVGDLINRGGFGAVYRGTDTSEGNRPCAIKEIYDVTPSTRRQALMEASVLFTFRSKHLPEVYDALEANGRFYLIMQLIEGQNLLQLLTSRVPGGIVGEQEPFQLSIGPCSEQEVLSWLLPIIDILQELHSRNPPVMHRDIKPGNIILAPQHITVLVDFGLTKLYDPNASSQTLGRAVTEGFSPIEQYVGKTSPQSDIYSLGATMYLLLTNRLPPAGIGRDSHDHLLPPRQLNPSLSLKMERILLKALAVRAEQRYQSMRELAQALREPAFDAYNDQTISAPPMPISSQDDATIVAPVQGLAGSAGGVNHPGQQQIYLRNPQNTPVQQPRNPQGQVPLPVYGPTPLPQGYPGGYPSQPGYPNPSLVAPVQQPWKRQRPLPTPTGQGCLWGLLQGILAALLVLSSRQVGDFYLATLLGFCFYVVAGFMTTYRGGGSIRGGWAGYWAGIYGTLIFWVSVGLGLAIEFVSQLQKINKYYPDLTPQEVNQRAWNAITPAWPQVPLIFPQQPTFVNFVATMLIGILVAWTLGWLGGMFGKSRQSAKQAAGAPVK